MRGSFGVVAAGEEERREQVRQPKPPKLKELHAGTLRLVLREMQKVADRFEQDREWYGFCAACDVIDAVKDMSKHGRYVVRRERKRGSK